MAYVTTSEMYDYYDKRTLAALSNDSGNNQVVTSILQKAIDRAAALLDGYLGHIYTLSGDRIKDLNAELAYAFLLGRRVKTMERSVALTSSITRTLREIRAGRQTLNGSLPDSASISSGASEAHDLMSRCGLFEGMEDPIEGEHDEY